MIKYTVTISEVHTAYAEVEIEAEDAEDAYTRAWEMLDAGEIELMSAPGEIEIDVYKAD
jgi:hypothetical protein